MNSFYYIYVHYFLFYIYIYSLHFQNAVQNLASEPVTSVSLSPFLYDIHPEEWRCCPTKRSYISG